ncbi:MAG: tRNA lysidine(34) synthetase TilS [Rhodanobacter sp.]
MSERLSHYLDAALASLSPAALCVAFSGGADSTALLHALAQLTSARARGLRALHVDHRMHASSGAWATHCLDVCAALGVSCEVLPVHVDTSSGLGIEASARDARYAALATRLRAGEYLLLAHHRDDQAETVLLKLLRGAGPEGLGGMRALRPFAGGKLWRPLLELPRQQLSEYVTARELECIHDPSNDDTRLARNHLRRQVLPLLTQHWPQAVDSIVHSARLSQQAADALQTAWLIALETLHDPATGSLDAAGWLATESALREPMLDHWLRARGLPAPTTAQRLQIEHQCGARAGQQPCIRWRGAELHIWRGRLWATPPAPDINLEWEHLWHGEQLLLPDGGMLSLSHPAVRLAEPLRVRLRRGGERIKPAGDRHTRELCDLFQQAGTPPWRRAAVPLIDAGNELVAVADRWISDRGMAIFEQAGAQPLWQSPH